MYMFLGGAASHRGTKRKRNIRRLLARRHPSDVQTFFDATPPTLKTEWEFTLFARKKTFSFVQVR